MLKKRIIPCLDIRDGRTVKGVNFVDITDAGDPVELATRYSREGADELVFLDITATVEKRKTLITLVEKVASAINIPFTVGGGITSVDEARAILNAGADKISVNSAAVRDPSLVSRLATAFGNQCVVLAIDTKYKKNDWFVYLDGGRTETEINTLEWAQQACKNGAGEILLTSMNNDGTKKGFACEITDRISRSVNVPLIASGGAGSMEDFKDLFSQTAASAALAASIFHYSEISIPALKDYLKYNNIPIR